MMRYLLLLLALLLTACAPSSLIVMPDFVTLTPSRPASDDGVRDGVTPQPVPTPTTPATSTPTATPGPITDAEGEYYRGFFDMCMHDYGNVTYCLKLTRSARAAGWYMQPSTGWVWPFEVSY